MRISHQEKALKTVITKGRKLLDEASRWKFESFVLYYYDWFNIFYLIHWMLY